MKKNKFKLLITLIILISVLPIVFKNLYLKIYNQENHSLISKKIFAALRKTYSESRNVWQSYCSSYDPILLYVPKNYECEFDNFEFNTAVSFDNFLRKDIYLYDKSKKNVLVIGDSIAMGWGVNDNQTFSYELEKRINVNIDNSAISSYGTARELIVHENLNNRYNLIIIQYNNNDFYENYKYVKNEVQFPRPKKYFDLIASNKKSFINRYFTFSYQFYNWFFIQPVKRRIFKNKLSSDAYEYDDGEVFYILIKQWMKKNNQLLNGTKILIAPMSGLGSSTPDNFKEKIKELLSEYKNIHFYEINFDLIEHFFELDDHLNSEGHLYASEEIEKYILKNNLLN